MLRLLSLLAAVLVLCASGTAQAGNVAVPMCGDHNESVAAPPIFRSTDGGSIQALPCQPPEQFQASSGAPLSPERVIVHDAPERMLSMAALLVAQTASSRLSIASACRALERPGFAISPFRPPCAAARVGRATAT